MLVVVEAMFDTIERLSRSVRRRLSERYINLLTLTYINIMRVGFFLLRQNSPKAFFSGMIQIYLSW